VFNLNPDWCIWAISIVLVIACLINGCSLVAVSVPNININNKYQKPIRGTISNRSLSTPSKSESAKAPLIQKSGEDNSFNIGLDGYFIEPHPTDQNMIIFFTSGFLFLFGGIHTSIFNWTWVWGNNIYADNPSDARLAAIFLSMYWGGFTLSSILLVRLQLKFAISNIKMLITNILGGFVVSGFLLLTRTQANNELLKHPIWLWLGFPLLGFFTYGIFPAALCIPNDKRIWLTGKAKYQIMLGQSLGEVFSPLLMGLLLVLQSSLPSFVWIIFGHFCLGFIFFFGVLGYSMFSRDLAEMSKTNSKELII